MCHYNISRHVNQCVHTQGRFKTRHENNAWVYFVHDCHVDFFKLQVSNNTGCHFCSIISVMKNFPKYVTKVVTWTGRCLIHITTTQVGLPYFWSNIITLISLTVGRVAQSVWRLATRWTVRGSNSGEDEIFRTCPDRPWGPPSLLYNWYRVFPGSKERRGRDADPSLPSSAVVKQE